jgi:hypothetical protein
MSFTGSDGASFRWRRTLPVDYRKEVKRLLTATDNRQRRLDETADGELRTFAITTLSHKPEAVDFL